MKLSYLLISVFAALSLAHPEPDPARQKNPQEWTPKLILKTTCECPPAVCPVQYLSAKSVSVLGVAHPWWLSTDDCSAVSMRERPRPSVLGGEPKEVPETKAQSQCRLLMLYPATDQARIVNFPDRGPTSSRAPTSCPQT